MKKLLFLLLTSTVLLSSCESDTCEQEPCSLVNIHCPIVVTAKAEEVRNDEGEILTFGSIVLQGADMKMKSFSTRYHFGSALVESKEIGDTIVHCVDKSVELKK